MRFSNAGKAVLKRSATALECAKGIVVEILVTEIRHFFSVKCIGWSMS